MNKYDQLKKLAEMSRYGEWQPKDPELFPSQILALIAENERLNACLKWEQNRAERIGTHGLGCESWGPTHYECLLREHNIIKAEVERLEADNRSKNGSLKAFGEQIGKLGRAVKNRDRQIDKLRAEVEALRKDAGRYRWLRSPAAWNGFQLVMEKSGVNLDAAIDAARGET